MGETCRTSSTDCSTLTFLSKLKKKRGGGGKRLKLRLWIDLPLDSSPWQKRAGAPFSHIACPRPPQSYSGCLDCPWFVRLRCVLDAGMDCIQHPIRSAAESKTGKKEKNEQIHAPSRCALSSSCRPTRSSQVPLTDWQKTPEQGRAQPSLETATLITGHAFLIFTRLSPITHL